MYYLITSSKDKGFLTFKECLRDTSLVALDTETHGLDFFTDPLRLIQVGCNGTAYVFDVENGEPGLTEAVVDEIIKSDVTCILHNAKFDLKFLKTGSGKWIEKVYDTQLVEEIILAGYIGVKYPSLLKLVDKYCGVTLDKEVRSEFIDSPSITNEMIVYAAEDVLYLHEIREKQLEQVKELGLGTTLRLEMALVPVTARMEYIGINLNKEEWTKVYQMFEQKAAGERKKIVAVILDEFMLLEPVSAYVGYESLKIPHKTKKLDLHLRELTDPYMVRVQLNENFNINSPAQLKSGLEACGVVVESTAEGVLRPLSGVHPVIELILNYREFSKRASSYGKNFLDYVHEKTGRLHAELNQTGTVTGRVSYSSPSLQNIPTDKDENDSYIYRRCFEAEPGWSLIATDYSQMELRYAGAVSGEIGIINAYKNDIDIHDQTASDILDKPIELITGHERQDEGKTINFSILYGTTAYGINRHNPKIPVSRAEWMMEKFFVVRPKLKVFIDETGDEAAKTLSVRTAIGRLRRWEDKQIFDEDWGPQAYVNRVKREAVSTVIQGSCADIVKLAMLRLYNDNPFGKDFRMVLQVHDEIVCEFKNTLDKEEVRSYVERIMEEVEQVFLGETPAKAESSINTFWAK